MCALLSEGVERIGDKTLERDWAQGFELSKHSINTSFFDDNDGDDDEDDDDNDY